MHLCWQWNTVTAKDSSNNTQATRRKHCYLAWFTETDIPHSGDEIADPYGKRLETYRECFGVVQRSVEQLLNLIDSASRQMANDAIPDPPVTDNQRISKSTKGPS